MGFIIPDAFMLTFWATWIEAHQDDWNAVAQLPRIEQIMSHIIRLQDDYELGIPHAYLGILSSLIPPAMDFIKRAATSDCRSDAGAFL